MGERLRYEILDHLTEAAAHGTASYAVRARSAIAQFGSVGEIARDYRAVIVETRQRSLRWIVVMAILVVFLVMRLRGFVLEPGWRDHLVSTSWGSILMGIDRYAFAIGLAVLLWGVLTERFRPTPSGVLMLRALPTTRGFVGAALPAVLILLSALAGIGSFLNPAGSSLLVGGRGMESVIVAALTTISIIILSGLFKLASAYLKAHSAVACDHVGQRMTR